MRRNDEAARRYAKALFQLSAAGDQVAKPAQILEELRAFEKIFTKDAEIRKFLSSPIVTPEEKKEALAGLESALPSISRFLNLLVEADRIDLFREVVREFELCAEEASGEISVTVETARKFSDRTMDEIRQLLEAQWKKKIKVHHVVNPEILGGFIARTASKSMNASAAAQLERLGEQLVSAKI